MCNKIDEIKDLIEEKLSPKKKTSPWVIALAILGGILAIAAIAYAVYYFFIPWDDQDFEDFDEEDDSDEERDYLDIEGDE